MSEPCSASEAAAALGRIRTPKKLAAQRANVARINQAREPAPCNCGQAPHRYTCPVAKREKLARHRAKVEAGKA